MRLILAALLVAVPVPAFAQKNGVTLLCITAGGTKQICDCATKALEKDIGGEISAYGRISITYLNRQNAGVKMESAWNEALGIEAARQGKGMNALLAWTNRIGEAHEKAIRACAG